MVCNKKIRGGRTFNIAASRGILWLKDPTIFASQSEILELRMKGRNDVREIVENKKLSRDFNRPESFIS